MFIRRRLLHGLYTHNLRGLIHRVMHHVVRLAKPVEAGVPEAMHPFDEAHSTDTSGFISGDDLRSGLPADLYNTAYYAISPSTLKNALSRIPVPLSDYTFIDLGCGKGRALLVAAELPFKQIIGVEISAKLCDTARKNVSDDPRISIVEQDAAVFTFPDGPVVAYFYNPFLAPFLKKVLKNLELQWKNVPRDMFILSAYPAYPKLMSRFNFLRLVWEQVICLSPEDATADRHGATSERYALYQTCPLYYSGEKDAGQ